MPDTPLIYLLDRKRFTNTMRTRSDGSQRWVYALELRISCSEKGPERLAMPPEGTEPFVVMLDTGNSGEGSLSLEDFQQHVRSPVKYDDLPFYQYETTLADGSKVRPKCWKGDIWVHFDGKVRGNDRTPVPVRLTSGLPVFPGSSSVSTLGMGALRKLQTQVEIDYKKQEFSVRVPTGMA